MLQTSLPYTLTLPDGSSRVIGPDSTAPGFIAHLTRITSDRPLDSSDNQVAAGDGALIGDAYRGGRTVVLDLLIADHDPLERARRIEWLQRINGVLRDTEGIAISWTEATGWRKELAGLRPSDYVTVGDAWPKELQLTLKTGNPYILSSEIHSRELEAEYGSVSLFNGGNAPAAPKFWIYGPCDNFTLTNAASGETLVFAEEVEAGDYIEIDAGRRTVLRNGSQNAYGALDFSSSSFFTISPLSADTTLNFSTTNGGSGTRLVVRWQSAWE